VLWTRLFDVAHFTVDTELKTDPFVLALHEEKAPPAELTVIAFPGEEVLARAAVPPSVAADHEYREHLLVSSSASSLFRSEAFAAPPDPRHPNVDPILDPDLEALLGQRHPPRPLEVITQGDPASGARSYTFTIDESLRLIAQQQRSSGQSELALVLPGGGVKAAYQSTIVDHLYGPGNQRRLRNTGLGKREGSLEVRSVLGTSGGALLGYFVAQFGESGPFHLADILWRPGGNALESKDIFAATDMLRYISVVWTFLVLCVLLALVTGMHTSRFYSRSVTRNGAWRWRLMTLLIVFFAVPMLIRFVTGGDDIEHVPIIEGIFYSTLTILVMFCDQCLVYSKEDNETRPLGWHVILLAAAGGLLVGVSMLGTKPGDALQEPVAIGVAFALLSVIFLGSPMLLLYVSNRFGELRRRLLDILVSLVAVLVLCALGVPERLAVTAGYLVAFLMLIGLAVFAYWYAHRPNRKPLVGTLLAFLTLLSTAVLCWPPARNSAAPGLFDWSFVDANAMETTRLAPFLASTGCLLLVIAAMVWVYQRREYTMERGDDFSLGLGLIVVHALATSAAVAVIAAKRPQWVHNLEMTPSFWVALTVAGVVLAALLLSLATVVSMLRRAVEFLTSEHPNGSLVPRRYARMLAVITMSLLWWNGIVAPALYGNDAAWKYLAGAVRNFDAAFRSAAHQQAALLPRGFIPTAKFVAPTNTLDDDDATRYFLFLTESDPSFDLPRRVVGAEWKVYPTTSRRTARSNCRKVIDPGCAPFVQDVIFSSGSPFPIFAAHRVNIPGEQEKLGLIDGGYSNDVPIDAARTIAARQVLVIHSSRPAGEEPHEHVRKSSFSFAPGMLIRNAQRLPSFMFERGQQVDRLSRQNLFVVGLAPMVKRGDPWPGLAQFDAPTVNEMLDKATADIHERIGFAESWGEPRFRFSQQIAAAVLPAIPAATPAGPGSLRPAPRAAH
jgi:predicted acylesterase/phospholipase RssA